MKYKYKTFDDWFHQPEGFSLRSERFYEALGAHVDDKKLQHDVIAWVKAAFEYGRIQDFKEDKNV